MLLYDDFVKAIVNIDFRNRIEKSEGNDLEYGVPEIYKFYDFVDVEVPCFLGNIKFVSRANLKDMKKKYSYIDADCIFATNNGEPLFTKDDKVFTYLAGNNKVFYEKIANSFEAFVEKILSE